MKIIRTQQRYKEQHDNINKLNISIKIQFERRIYFKICLHLLKDNGSMMLTKILLLKRKGYIVKGMLRGLLGN